MRKVEDLDVTVESEKCHVHTIKFNIHTDQLHNSTLYK